MFSKKENAETSKESSETKTEVISYPVISVQKAKLYKQ